MKDPQDCTYPQEPMAWIERDIQCDDFDPDSVTFEKPRIAASSGREWVPLYTTPPQRKPLTVWEIELWAAKPINRVALCRAIEAAHGIKGNV